MTKEPLVKDLSASMKDFKLDEYHMFMNKHVLNAIGVDYYDLLKRGLAFNFE